MNPKCILYGGWINFVWIEIVLQRKLCENGFIRHKKRKLDEGELLRRRKKMIGQFNAKNLEKKDSDQETEKPLNGNENKGNALHQGIPFKKREYGSFCSVQ